MPRYRLTITSTEFADCYVEAPTREEAREIYWEEMPVTETYDHQDEDIYSVQEVDEDGYEVSDRVSNSNQRHKLMNE